MDWFTFSRYKFEINMNKCFRLFAISMLFFTACTKESDPGSESQLGSKVKSSSNSVPSSYTQKLLIELFSSAVCPTCPDADYKFRNFVNLYPDRVYGASIHSADAMSINMFQTCDSMLDVTAFSSGSFNRLPYNGISVLPKTQWVSSNVVNTCLQKTAKCGLKITSRLSGNDLTCTVTTGFAQQLNGDYRLTVYLVEDSVSGNSSGYNQANYYNTTVGNPFYNLGNPIIGYIHNEVLRKVLTPNKGASISPTNSIAANSAISMNFKTNVSPYNTSNLYIVAFINKLGTTTTTHEILNVQRVIVGGTKNWD